MSRPLLQIDLDAVLSRKLGRRKRWVPGIVTRWLKHIIRQDDLNALLRNNYPRTGADFCEGVFADLDITVKANNPDALPPADNRKVLIVSNHPLGGLDGMALIHYFARRYGGKVHFLVNDLLMTVDPLREVFVPVNKHGAQSRQALHTVEECLASDNPVLIFPAGLVSRRASGGAIHDLEWRKTFVNMAIKYRRDIIPVFFNGRNSKFFYNFARFRKKTGLRFNIEMVLLPSEIFKSRGATFDLTFGDPVPYGTLEGGTRGACTAARICNLVYSMAPAMAAKNKPTNANQ